MEKASSGAGEGGGGGGGGASQQVDDGEKEADPLADFIKQMQAASGQQVSQSVVPQGGGRG